MAVSFWNQVARLPRHPAADVDKVCVEVLCPSRSSPLPAQLRDLSRHGIRFVVAKKLPDDEPVTVRLEDTESGHAMTLPAKICWQKPADNGALAVGCQFEGEIDWAVIGEYFLHGILEADVKQEHDEA